MPLKITNSIGLVMLLLLGIVSHAEEKSEPTPNIVQQQCIGCHLPEADGKLSRISYQRKTPEGWEMTISRMQLIHKLQISNQENVPTSATRRALVKHLADHQGLAPAETTQYRYLIEQDLSIIESFDPEQAQMCGRCHSAARFALQRRTESEWNMLVHYHLGQYPSTEYSLYGRDRDWFGVAKNEIVPQLAKQFPLETEAWSEWLATPKADLSGRWRIVGEMPGKGSMAGIMTSEPTEKDDVYRVTFTGAFANGEPLSGEGQAIVYTGYEWRAGLELNGQRYRQVLAASEDGNSMSGRTFEKDQPEMGIRTSLVRDDGSSRLLSVVPNHIRPGEVSTLTLHGTALQGDIDLGPDLQVIEVSSRNQDSITLTVKADGPIATGHRSVAVGTASLDNAIAVYRQVDSLRVTPAYAIGRLGDNGGSTRKSLAPFTAVGIDHGPDGEPGTPDDIEIGAVQASWSVEPFNEIAQQDRDTEFAGLMNPQNGLFTPAGAGPNPARKMHTNNAGNLKVIATLGQEGQQARGEAHLIVTVQRWNNPPLK